MDSIPHFLSVRTIPYLTMHNEQRIIHNDFEKIREVQARCGKENF